MDLKPYCLKLICKLAKTETEICHLEEGRLFCNFMAVGTEKSRLVSRRKLM